MIPSNLQDLSEQSALFEEILEGKENSGDKIKLLLHNKITINTFHVILDMMFTLCKISAKNAEKYAKIIQNITFSATNKSVLLNELNNYLESYTINSVLQVKMIREIWIINLIHQNTINQLILRHKKNDTHTQYIYMFLLLCFRFEWQDEFILLENNEFYGEFKALFITTDIERNSALKKWCSSSSINYYFDNNQIDKIKELCLGNQMPQLKIFFPPHVIFEQRSSKLINIASFYGNSEIIEYLQCKYRFDDTQDDEGYYYKEYFIIGSNNDIIFETDIIDKLLITAIRFYKNSTFKRNFPVDMSELLYSNLIYESLKNNNIPIYLYISNQKFAYDKHPDINDSVRFGFTNPNINCFANSIFNLLFHAQLFRNTILQKDFRSTLTNYLKHVFIKMIDNKNITINLKEFYEQTYISNFSNININEEQDAAEILNHLISYLRNYVQSYFRLCIISTESSIKDYMYILPLNLEKNNIEDILFSEFDNTLITCAPRYLFVQLKRFRRQENQTKYVSKCIKSQKFINLSEFTQNKSEALYHRIGVIIYLSNGDCDHGHYKCLLSNGFFSNKGFICNNVIEYNDSQVRTLNESAYNSNEVKKNGYIYLYVRSDSFKEDTNLKVLTFDNDYLYLPTPEDSNDTALNENQNDDGLNENLHDEMINENSNDGTLNENLSGTSSDEPNEHEADVDNLSNCTLMSSEEIANDYSDSSENIEAYSCKEDTDNFQTDLNPYEEDCSDYPFLKRFDLDKIIQVNDSDITLLSLQEQPPRTFDMFIPRIYKVENRLYHINNTEEGIFENIKINLLFVDNNRVLTCKAFKNSKIRKLILINPNKIPMAKNSIIEDIKIRQSSQFFCEDGFIFKGSFLVYCSSPIINITLSENIKYIGKRSFSCSNSNVKSVIFPKTIKAIYKEAFLNCKNLEIIHFP